MINYPLLSPVKKRMKNYKEKIENSLKMMINISWGKLSTIDTRVEFSFSKPNIEISITITKASKLRSFEASNFIVIWGLILKVFEFPF